MCIAFLLSVLQFNDMFSDELVVMIPGSSARKPASHGCEDQPMPSKTCRSLSCSRSSGGVRSIIQCIVCCKTFNNSSALAKHKLIHSEERRYICNQCSKSFKRQDHLYVFGCCQNCTCLLFVKTIFLFATKFVPVMSVVFAMLSITQLV